MVAQILSFAAHPRSIGPSSSDWTQAERAEFYRVTELLGRAGLPIVSETGLSDENEPWIVFLREDTGDVIAHIARIDGEFIAASVTTEDVFKGRDFRQVLDQIVQRQPLVLPAARHGQRLYMHPTAILTAFLVTALMHTAHEARAEGNAAPVWSSDVNTGAGDESGVQPALNVLRAALMTKIEALRSIGQDNQTSQPASQMLTAAIAAVALALLSADQSSSSDHVTASLLASAPTDESARQGDWVEQAMQRLLAKLDAIDAAAAQNDSAADTAQVAAARTEQVDLVQGDSATRVHEQLHATQRGAADWATALTRADLGTAQAAGMTQAAPAHASAEAQAPLAAIAEHNDSAATVVVSKASTAAAQDNTHQVAAAPVDVAIKPSSDVVYHFEISESAMRFFNLKTLGSHFGDSLAQNLTLNVASLSGSFTLNQDATIPTAPTIAVVDQPNSPSTAPTDAANVIGSILSFAFAERNELSLSTGQQWLMGSVVENAISGHHGGRIIIIDAPGINAPIFQFSQDLIMMTRATAESYLGQIQQPAHGVQLGLNDGSMVSLIGVVELA